MAVTITERGVRVNRQLKLKITERGVRDSCLGPALLLKIYTEDYRPLYWREVWEGFTIKYPGRWAVQVFPPEEKLLDEKPVYHLFVLQDEPVGFDLR